VHEDELVETALEKAEVVLEGNEGKLGLLGARNAYQQVWARDAAISGLGLLLSRRPKAQQVFARSFETLQRFQSPLGNIPHCVGFPNPNDPALFALKQVMKQKGVPASPSVVEPEADTAHSGCVDSSLWYILGRYYQHKVTKNTNILRESWASMERAFLWLRYQDSNECGLLEVHEAMDWADLFANRYNVLYDNVLYYACAQSMRSMAEALGKDGAAYQQTADDIRKKVNLLLWVGPEQERDLDWVLRHRREWLYPIRITDVVLVQRPYYLPYMAFRDYGDRCDVLGNLLAILFGVADQTKAERILDYIEQTGLASPHPIRVLHPVVNPGDKDWREYYRLRNLNQPYQYHNGGIWPFVGGFYVAALAKAGHVDEAKGQLARLAALNQCGRKSEWEFNEWFHGQSGRPMGFAYQSWSAGMYIYAYHCVKSGFPIAFGGEFVSN